VKVKDVAIVYVSGGGNTKEVATLLSSHLDRLGISHDSYRVGSNEPSPNLSLYRMVLLGSYTIGEGRTPQLMVSFLKSLGYRHDNVAVFGTGESQWREYCGAAVRLALFHGSKYPVLKIEQSPRGSQEHLVEEWIMEVLENGRIIEEI